MSFQQKYEVATWERCAIPAAPEIVKADEALKADPTNPDLWMEKGLALAKYSFMREAVECYSIAMTYNPFKWQYYRHRAHRFISMWRFEDAAADFTISSRLNHQDWDTFYHLGLSYFLLGNYEKAAKAYQRCLELTKLDSKLIALCDWYWMTLKRLGRDEDAAKILERISLGMDAGDNVAYYERLLVYKGLKNAEEALDMESNNFNDLARVSIGFGIGNYYLLNGDEEKAIAIWKRTVALGEELTLYTAFSYLASKIELTKRGLL